MITSKLTTKAQTTIPQLIRDALGVAGGDELAHVIEPGRVILTKAPKRKIRVDLRMGEDPFATFREWDSEADRCAYADL